MNISSIDADPGYTLIKTCVLAALPQDLFDRLAAIDSPTHFLVLALINAPNANCAQMMHLLVSEPSMENASLYNTVLNKMTGKGCSFEE